MNDFLQKIYRNRMLYLFLLPACTLATAFFLVPFFYNFYISLCDWNIIFNKGALIGFENYRKIFQDPIFTGAIGTTTLYTLLTVPLLLLFGLLFALLAERSTMRGVTLFRMVYFVPWVIPWLTAGLIWRFMYNDVFGLINYLLRATGLTEEPVLFFSTKMRALFSVIAVCVWKTAGYNMIILLTGLKSVPEQVYEAADIDGASGRQKFLHVTLPLIRPSIALMAIMAIVGSYLAFDHFWIVTRGAPAHQTETILTWLYQTSFFRFRMGEGAAMSVILLLITGFFAVVQVKFFKLLNID